MQSIVDAIRLLNEVIMTHTGRGILKLGLPITEALPDDDAELYAALRNAWPKILESLEAAELMSRDIDGMTPAKEKWHQALCPHYAFLSKNGDCVDCGKPGVGP